MRQDHFAGACRIRRVWRQPAGQETLQRVRAWSDSIRHPAARPAAGDSRQRWPLRLGAALTERFQTAQRAAPRPKAGGALGIGQIRSSAWSRWTANCFRSRYGPVAARSRCRGHGPTPRRRSSCAASSATPENVNARHGVCCRPRVTEGRRQHMRLRALVVASAPRRLHELARVNR